MDRHRDSRFLFAGVLVVSALSVPAVPPAAAAPAGFTDTAAYSVPTPTALTHLPDGRLLITSDGGQLRVVRDGALRPDPALDLYARACTDGERGLLGVAADPGFRANSFIYLFWTFNKHGSCAVGTSQAPVNRVARYVLGSDDRVVAGSERVLVDNIPSPAAEHNAGDLKFGTDGLLYVTTGDGGCTIGSPTRCAALNTNSRRLDVLNGKVLRITRDGAIPAGNPYAAAVGARRCGSPAGVPAGTGPCTETYASGFRNPFRMAVRPGSKQMYVNDVGQGAWEEVNALEAGRDYGWNVREGFCATGSRTDCGPTSFQNPVFAYDHTQGCASITGGAFVPVGGWPAPWSGSYLFADFVCGGIHRMAPDGAGGFTRQPFLPEARGPVHLAFAPYAGSVALYYLDYYGNTVHRVTYGSANARPVASFYGWPYGLRATFEGKGSYDPDTGDAVREWRWDFGDGSTAVTTTSSVVHPYEVAGEYPVTLRVVDTSGAVSEPYTVPFFAGEYPPTLKVTWPADSARFAAGQNVRLSAVAEDPDEGVLPGSAVTWTVRRRHGGHFHPWAGPVTGSSISFAYPPPEDLAAATNSSLEVSVVARDRRGLATTSTRTLLPRTVALTFVTSPAGGTVVVAGTTLRTPASVTSWANAPLRLNVADQTIDGRALVFGSWSDGGTRAHDIRAPSTPTTYTARLVPPAR